MHITSASFSYPNISGDKRADLARSLRADTSGCPALVLNTCLRLEVLVEGDVEILAHSLELLFEEPPDIAAATVRGDADAAVHLFRVVAGLESPIVGEREILTQFRDALEALEESGMASGLFSKLLQESVALGRKARQLLPESPHASLAAIAAQIVGGVDRVAVLGSGTMSSAIIGALRELPAPPSLTVVARTPARVRDSDVEVWSFDRAADALREFPAIVSATSAKQHPVPDAVVISALADRRERGIIVDLAMPPDFRVPESANLTYVDIDQLARLAGRRPRLDDADEIVHTAAVDAYRRFSDHQQIGPLITALMSHADQIVDQAAERFTARLNGVDDAEVLRNAAHNVARTLMAAPVEYLKTAERTAANLVTVAEAFGIAGRDSQTPH